MCISKEEIEAEKKRLEDAGWRLIDGYYWHPNQAWWRSSDLEPYLKAKKGMDEIEFKFLDDNDVD